MQSYPTESLVVLNTWQSYSNALATCKAFGESLWSPWQADFLPYLSYEGKSRSLLASEQLLRKLLGYGFGRLDGSIQGGYGERSRLR